MGLDCECIFSFIGHITDKVFWNMSRKWVCSGIFWQAEWLIRKCVQRVSEFWHLLASWMADKASPENVSREWVGCGIFWQAGWLMRLLPKMCPACECVLASPGKLDGWWGSSWKCVQHVSVFWHLLASWMSDEAPSENVSREWVCSGIFWQAGWLIRPLLKMCPGSECFLASSSGKLDGWWGSFWKCVQSVSVFWHLLPSWMADEAPSENVSRMWVCSAIFCQAGWLMRLLLKMCPGCECVLAFSAKLDVWWGLFWKCVQGVSVFWHLLASWMADEAPSENVSSLWVPSGIFCQAEWLMRLLLKMCPERECVLASSAKLDGWRGSFWKCVQQVSVFWHLLPSWMADEASSENVSREWVCSGIFWQAGWLMMPLLKMCPDCECLLASSGKLDGWWGSFWNCVQSVSVFWHLLASWMADEAPSENVSSLWVCSGKLDGWWGSYWKSVQDVSVFWHLLPSWMSDEAPSENVSRMWVCSGIFCQAG